MQTLSSFFEDGLPDAENRKIIQRKIRESIVSLAVIIRDVDRCTTLEELKAYSQQARELGVRQIEDLLPTRFAAEITQRHIALTEILNKKNRRGKRAKAVVEAKRAVAAWAQEYHDWLSEITW